MSGISRQLLFVGEVTALLITTSAARMALSDQSRHPPRFARVGILAPENMGRWECPHQTTVASAAALHDRRVQPRDSFRSTILTPPARPSLAATTSTFMPALT